MATKHILLAAVAAEAPMNRLWTAMAATLFLLCPITASAALTVCNGTTAKLGVMIATSPIRDATGAFMGAGNDDVLGPWLIDAGQCKQVIDGDLATCDVNCPTGVRQTGYRFIAQQVGQTNPLIWTGAVESNWVEYCYDPSGNWFYYHHQQADPGSCPSGQVLGRFRHLTLGITVRGEMNDYTLNLTSQNADNGPGPYTGQISSVPSLAGNVITLTKARQ